MNYNTSSPQVSRIRSGFSGCCLYSRSRLRPQSSADLSRIQRGAVDDLRRIILLITLQCDCAAGSRCSLVVAAAAAPRSGRGADPPCFYICGLQPVIAQKTARNFSPQVKHALKCVLTAPSFAGYKLTFELLGAEKEYFLLFCEVKFSFSEYFVRVGVLWWIAAYIKAAPLGVGGIYSFGESSLHSLEAVPRSGCCSPAPSLSTCSSCFCPFCHFVPVWFRELFLLLYIQKVLSIKKASQEIFLRCSVVFSEFLKK